MVRMKWKAIQTVLTNDLDTRGVSKYDVQRTVNAATGQGNSSNVYKILAGDRQDVQIETLDMILAAMGRDWTWLVRQLRPLTKPPAGELPCKPAKKRRTPALAS